MGHERSSGIATVMFTDVEASTDLTTRLGDDAAAALFTAHHKRVRDLIGEYHGRNVESTGDGFLVLFDSARGALACALAIQRELAAQDDGIRVRIGLNAGEILEGDDDLFGAAINLTKRVMDRADGGQILITDAVRQLVGTVPDARFRDRGRVALKGFPERQRLHEVRPAEPLPQPKKAGRRSPRWPLASAVLAAAAGALAVLLVAAGGDEPVKVGANSVAILDAEDGHVIETVPVGVRPAEVAVGAGSVWVANRGDNSVTQIGARSRRVAGTVSPGISVDGLGAGGGGVWVADNNRAVARSIDPSFRTAGRSVPIGHEEVAITESQRPLAVGADDVWVTYGFAEIARIDPKTGRLRSRTRAGNRPSAVAVDGDAVWVSDERDGTVTRIDRRTSDIVATIAVGQGASGIAAGSGGVWVAVPLEDRVKRIDPASNAVADTVRVAGGPAAVAVGSGAVWVTSRRGGTVTRIDPRAARVTGTTQLGHSPQGVAVAGGAVWVAVQDSAPAASAASGRPGVLRSLRPDGLSQGTDPASAASDQVQYATCALLLNYPDQPFPAGSELRPDVARALPEVSDGGRTYTFRLRPGFRFSPPSNAPVTAEAFRHAIERSLHPRSRSYARFVVPDIAGFAAYRAGRAEHIAGVTARGDTLTVRLTAPSATLPDRLASSFFCAIPPTTPITSAPISQIPSAGPYYIASYEPKRRLLLRRNPNYGGDRPARPREIDIDLDTSRARAEAAVEAGRADHVNAIRVDRIPSLERRFGAESAVARAGGQRYFSGATPVLHFLNFNLRRPLFAGERMRRAVNLAIDRRALARRVPFPDGPGRPTDQFIPSGIPGFKDEAIYPLGGPDAEAARRVAGPGRSRRAVLYTCNLEPCREQGRIVRSNLAAIGIEVDVRQFPFDEMFDRAARPGEPWDLVYYGWVMDFPDPSNFTTDLVAMPDESAIRGFRDRDLRERLLAATRLRNPARAREFERLDAEMARAAVAAPFATGATTEFFSSRVGCQVHQPMFGISLGALCIRD
jgi:class 3 adenylate cyclase/ABC-type oligopeptide transport system substrate-binding subunit/DNA-binding beta-propeller fold protein YncE